MYISTHICAMLIRNFGSSSSLAHMSLNCTPNWYSANSRLQFYDDCLKRFDFKSLIQRGRMAVRQINDIGYTMRDEENSKAQLVGGSLQVIGPVLYGLGIGG